MRRFLLLLLLICLPLHSFALQDSHLLSAGLAHELQHDQGVQHHHHEDDGSVHYDDSDESAQHAFEHSASFHLAWSPIPHPLVLTVEPMRSLASAEPAQFIPEPHLDCPHRPPALSLG